MKCETVSYFSEAAFYEETWNEGNQEERDGSRVVTYIVNTERAKPLKRLWDVGRW